MITFNVSRAYGALHIVSERRKRLIIRCKFNKNTVKSSVEARELKMGDRIKASDATNNISEFYKGKKVFITGATGFVGKALVEKLLRSCTGVDALFILMRTKKGFTVEQRTDNLFKDGVFSRLREKNPDIFEKVKVLPGDVGLPNLGLSEEDQLYLIDNIDIVFHSAATVKFNENLKTAVLLNTLGTKRVLELCQKMKQLKSCVHVSTAFSNSDKRVVEEKVYETTYNAYTVIDLVQNFPDEIVEILAPKLLGNHPNTYTFAKSLAEQLVLEHSGNIPTAIVRPSIITAAWKEPYPGWVDNLSGITGIVMECGRGTIKSIICDERCRMDLVPVDVVVNTLITSAWHTAVYRSPSMRVYNCTSGTLNPVTWKEFAQFTHKHSYEWPSKYVQWYPSFAYTTNKTKHSFYAAVYHNIPSMFLDVALVCSGRKPMMFKLSKKMNQALEAGSFFSTNEWTFGSSSYQSLIEAVSHAEDCEEFPVDLTLGQGFDWDHYVGDYLKGVRQFILKDEMTSLPAARKKLNRLYWFYKLLKTVPYMFAMEVLRQTLYKFGSVTEMHEFTQ